MAKKDKKVNAWQIIVAVFQALAALLGSLKKSTISLMRSLRQKRPKAMLRINKANPIAEVVEFFFPKVHTF